MNTIIVVQFELAVNGSLSTIKHSHVVVFVCDGVFILFITSKPEKSGSFSLLANCISWFIPPWLE